MTDLTPEQKAELNAIWDEAAAQPIPGYEPAKLSNLSEATRQHIIDVLNAPYPEPAAYVAPVAEADEFDDNRERDAGALRDADAIIKALAEQGHGDYSKYRNQIADLWDGEYGLWYGNDDCTTELNDPELKDLWLIQEDHYDQHMTRAEGKPKWDDMICYAGDYVFFA